MYHLSPNWNSRLLEPFYPALPPLRAEARDKIQSALALGELKVLSREQCYCGGRSFVDICNHDRYGLPFNAKLCRECGLIITDPMLAEETLALYYNQLYHQICFGDLKNLTRRGLFGANQGQLIFDRLWNFPATKIKNQARVLEIGAGVGNVLSEFRDAAQQKGLEVSLLGAEYSSECIDLIREMGLEVIEGGCREVLEKHDQPFDVLILSHMLEHVTDLDRFMNEFLKLASPETIIYIEAPGVLTLHAKPEYDFDFITYFTHAHSAHYNFETLKYHMRRFGLDCLIGNEITYGLFKVKPEVIQDNIRPEIGDQVLFYLANMEATRENSLKVMERIRDGEAKFNLEAKKTRDLNERIQQIGIQSTAQQQRHQQEIIKQKLHFEQHMLRLDQHKLQLERHALKLEQQKLVELNEQKQQLDQLRQAAVNEQKEQLERLKKAELIEQKIQLEQRKQAELAEQKQELEQAALIERKKLQRLIDQGDLGIKQKQREIDRQINMRLHLKKTISWRITAPLRALARLGKK